MNLYEHLSGIKNGFFIEAGAYDGVFQSTTLRLEHEGWNGILIEPSPNNCEKCSNYRRVPTINAALVSFEHDSPYVEGDFNLNGTSSKISKIPDYITDFHNEKFESTIQVPARTISSIIDEHNIDKIDFFSLDVEGYELEVLRGVDFNKVRPKYFLIETSNKTYYQKIIRDFMKDVGYDHIDLLHYTESVGLDGQGNDDLFRDKNN